MDWVPTIDDPSRPVYEGIVEALNADIAAGRLHRGQRLPTHRALAKALGVDLTTITRAYNEARRRGLTEARVGQGTFVAESQARAPRAAAAGLAFDLTMNLPPHPVEADLEGRIARGLAAMQRDDQPFDRLKRADRQKKHHRCPDRCMHPVVGREGDLDIHGERHDEMADQHDR